jgi:hypothetical protein
MKYAVLIYGEKAYEATTDTVPSVKTRERRRVFGVGPPRARLRRLSVCESLAGYRAALPGWSLGVPSTTGKRRETAGLHGNQNVLLTSRIGQSPQVREPVPATLPRWGSRVRIPSSAPGQRRFPSPPPGG